jgi:hypothetical protein
MDSPSGAGSLSIGTREEEKGKRKKKEKDFSTFFWKKESGAKKTSMGKIKYCRMGETKCNPSKDFSVDRPEI